MKFIIIFFLFLITGCQLFDPRISGKEHLDNLEERIARDIIIEAIQTQVVYHQKHSKFITSVEILSLDKGYNHELISIKKATTEQAIIEYALVRKKRRIKYFIGVIDIQPENKSMFLCETNKSYSKIKSIKRLLKKDCTLLPESQLNFSS